MKQHSSGSCVASQTGEAAANPHEHMHSDGQSCGSGHDHSHDPSHDDHGHDHDSCGVDGCGCGHDHGNRESTETRKDLMAIGIAVGLAVASYLVPVPAVGTMLMLAAILVGGAPVFWSGLRRMVKLDLEEQALLTIAVVAATLIGEMPEALLVTLLFRVGEILEDLAVARSRREVEAITQIIPDDANLLEADGSVTVVSAKNLAIGSRILIKSGERAPVDSIVLSGSSMLDTSSLTGESAPREVQPGDSILSGTVNQGGVLTCETINSFDNSTASKIVEMVKDSSVKKGKTERLISRFSRVYTPIVIVLAVLFSVVPPLLGMGSFSQWLSRSLVFLVASCPCALVISIPLSFFAGIGGSSKQGILIKGSRYMEALAKADTVVFDKTGTLTTGKLQVSALYPREGTDENELFRLAAISESYSNHPIAKAVVEAYGAPDTSDVAECEEITSHGMRVQMGGDEILCGSRRLMDRFQVDVSALPEANLYVAKNSSPLGAIAVYDHPRTDAADTIRQLKDLGIREVVMLTGDQEAAARATADQIGVDSVRANLLPADKVTEFEALQKKSSGGVVFVGDGINDSPVIARADAGVAMGIASDAAIEAADAVLLSDRLSSLPQAIRISRRTGRLARFNIVFALGVKLLVFILAIFGLASMWMAVFADVGVSILAVLNATRALRFE